MHKLILLVAIAPLLSCACRGGGSGTAAVRSAAVRSAAAPEAAPVVHYTYKVINSYPHDRRSYTQGLYWADGYLWEGTGQYGESALKKVELETGKAVGSVPLDAKYFGEGIALVAGKIYQLTWQNGTAFVYDAATLAPVDSFRYRGEGWGLTTDGRELYMSDGSSRIFVVDPATGQRKRAINVTLDGRNLMYLNELEWIDGKIWANIYYNDNIAVIDPATGRVEGLVDLTGILPAADHAAGAEVLNGIAWDGAARRIFVTGKYWGTLFEIAIEEK